MQFKDGNVVVVAIGVASNSLEILRTPPEGEGRTQRVATVTKKELKEFAESLLQSYENCKDDEELP